MKGNTYTNLMIGNRAGVNLELALMIMLLALAVIFGLQVMGLEIQSTYDEAAGMFVDGESFTAPTNPIATDNGDGTWTIGWDEGVSPYTIIEDGVAIDTDDASPYIYTPVAPGNRMIVIEDDEGSQTDPIMITIPYAPGDFAVFVGGGMSQLTSTFGLLATFDGGTTFTHIFTGVPYETSTHDSFTGVSVVNEEVWYATLTRKIIKTTDGGQTWEVQVNRPLSEGPFYQRLVSFYDEIHGFAVQQSSPAKVWYTDDGGQSWTPYNTSGIIPSSDNHAISADTLITLVAGNVYKLQVANGVLVETPLYTSTITGGWKTLQVISDTEWYVGGGNTTAYKIIKTTDGGTTWTEITTAYKYPSYTITQIAVSPDDTNRMWMTGASMTANQNISRWVWSTPLSSYAWTPCTPGGITGFHTITAFDDNTLYAAGRFTLPTRGDIYKSTDGGVSWVLVHSDTAFTTGFSDIVKVGE